MTYGENKKLTLALIEEYAPDLVKKTEDDDIALRLPFLYQLAYQELAMTKKIIATKLYNEIPDENKKDKYTAYSLPADLYQIKNVYALDKNNKPITAEYYTINKKIYLNDNIPGSTILEYYKYPQDINEETMDDFYLELDNDAQALLPYKVADDILKTDPSADYTAFATEYQRKLQLLDTRKNIPTVVLNEPEYDI
ncbi:MAG TPA: hypothetical protein OIM60_03600 [Clostridiaceae bacterium]|jgi:hypothetical protein|nr:hypothetical protein [Clostridiaceae bacterium]